MPIISWMAPMGWPVEWPFWALAPMLPPRLRLRPILRSARRSRRAQPAGSYALTGRPRGSFWAMRARLRSVFWPAHWIYRNDARRLGGRFSADGVRALYSGRIDYPGPACAARREVLASAPRTLLPANDPDEQGSCDHSTHLVRCDAARHRIRFGGTAHWHSGAMDHIWTLERRAFNVRMGS